MISLDRVNLDRFKIIHNIFKYAILYSGKNS